MWGNRGEGRKGEGKSRFLLHKLQHHVTFFFFLIHQAIADLQCYHRALMFNSLWFGLQKHQVFLQANPRHLRSTAGNKTLESPSEKLEKGHFIGFYYSPAITPDVFCSFFCYFQWVCGAGFILLVCLPFFTYSAYDLLWLPKVWLRKISNYVVWERVGTEMKGPSCCKICRVHYKNKCIGISSLENVAYEEVRSAFLLFHKEL